MQNGIHTHTQKNTYYILFHFVPKTIVNASQFSGVQNSNCTHMPPQNAATREN